MKASYETVIAPTMVYRVSRSAEPRVLPAWGHILGSDRGRYDDPLDVYRVLYTSTSPTGALIEALADLRPRYDRITEIAMISDEQEEYEPAYLALVERARAAMAARLAARYLSGIEIVDRKPRFVDLGAGSSRSQIELDLRLGRLKVGDFTGRDRNLSRQASRAVFNAGFAGLVAPSAEDAHAHTVAIFETARDSNAFGVHLDVITTGFADVDREAAAAATATLLGTGKYSGLVCPELGEEENVDAASSQSLEGHLASAFEDPLLAA